MKKDKKPAYVQFVMTERQYLECIESAKAVYAWVIGSPEGACALPITKKAARLIGINSKTVYARMEGKDLHVGSWMTGPAVIRSGFYTERV